GGRCSNSLLNRRRFRALDQFAGFNAGSFCRDFSRNIPVSDIFAFAQRGASKREPDTIINKTKIFCHFGHTIRREPLCKTWIIPVSVEHERRTHHHPAASIEPLLLLARSWQTIGVHQRDFPLKLNPPVIAPFQFRPCWLGPETPA